MSYLSSLSLESLLLLRLAFNNTQDIVDIEQDINDLYLFPERLASSYPDEWRSYIKRHLGKLGLNSDSLADILNDQHQHHSQQLARLHQQVKCAEPQYNRLINILDEVRASQQSGNVVPLKTPLHRWLEWAISN
jgi:hypothetical protein